MSADPKVLLQNILDCTRLIQEYTQALSKDDFLASIQVQDAVLRRIEIIGEAAKNFPPGWTDSYPEVPWRQIARMRDLLIHRYFSVDFELTWDTIHQDIPELERNVVAILATLH